MNIKQISILITFFILSGPFAYFFLINKYTVSFASIITLLVIIYLYRDEIADADFNHLIKTRNHYKYIYQALQFAIYSHAVSFLIFRPGDFLTDDLTKQYLIMPFYIIAVAPILEEIVYRKIIFGALHQKLNFGVSAFISSLIFAAFHLTYDRFLAYFLVGFTFCYFYKKAGSLYPIIVAHGLLNFISILVRTLKGG